MKIFCHIPRENWFGDRYGAEYKIHSGHSVTHSDLNCDLIWLLANWCWKQIPQQVLQNKKVVCTIHHIVPEKFNDTSKYDFALRDRFVDAYHVPCKKTKDFISQYTKKPIHEICYWVNPDMWPMHNKQEMKNAYSLPTNKLIIGSFQRDTEGSDLITPKLEKGPDKFCDYVENIKNSGIEPFVLLNGWRRQYVINRLKNANIDFFYKELPPLDEVSKMYSACDLYVVGSRHEGGPQSILECGVSKVPIVSTDVGIAKNILSDNCIFDVGKNCDVYFPTKQDIEHAYSNSLKYDIKKHVKEYDKLFANIAGELV